MDEQGKIQATGNTTATPVKDMSTEVSSLTPSLATSSSTMSSISVIFHYSPASSSLYSSVGWPFLLHSYGFGCLFFFLAFYAFFSILNLRSQLSARPYMSTINSFLCLLGSSRAASLLIDPYNLQHTLPMVLGTLLWDIGFPCLLSSFSLIQIAFLQLIQIDWGPHKFRKKTFLSVVVTVHFLCVLGTGIYSNFNKDLMTVKQISQVVFSIWGLILFGSFLHAGVMILGIFGNSSSGASTTAEVPSHKGIAGLFGFANTSGQNLASSLTAALVPTLLQPNSGDAGNKTGASSDGSCSPKIRITDESGSPGRSFAPDEEGTQKAKNTQDSANCPPSTSGKAFSSSLPSTSKDIVNKSQDVSTTNSCKDEGAPFMRPPSPVAPRRKTSSGYGSRRLNMVDRQESSSLDPGSSKQDPRKKSLTWCETEKSVSSTETNGSEKRAQCKSSTDTSILKSDIKDPPASSDTLLSAGREGGPDCTLQSILSHIAYVNQTALDYRLSRKLSRKNQVHRVIKLTSITAVLGIFLCVGELIRILSPYGIFASSVTYPSPWLWFTLQTLMRIIEFGMGATVANITKQPVNRPPHYAFSLRHKHHRESFYL